MEALISSAIALATSNSGAVSLTLSAIALAAGIILYFKKTKIDEYTSVGTLQHQQIDSLMAQVKLLSDELTKAREQLSEIHEQNMKLMVQVRESNTRIQELEDLLNSKKPGI